MKTEVQVAFNEMLDISKDIDKAVLFAPNDVLASNMDPVSVAGAVARASELASLGATRANEMGSQPMTQMVIETAAGFVFLARETEDGGMTILATGKKASRVGLVLYDLKTCLRDAREALTAAKNEDDVKEESK
ncbi:MAG: roadblock/LC7 domain-containing protein [Thermoleophilia bacterium]|jgi:predicted regulator of Ras-like GTPase activity (Roadblock/LC7/MglB family)